MIDGISAVYVMLMIVLLKNLIEMKSYVHNRNKAHGKDLGVWQPSLMENNKGF